MQITYSGVEEADDAADWTDRYPDAAFDLHGQTVSEAAANARAISAGPGAGRPGGVVRLIPGGAGRRRCADPDPGADPARGRSGSRRGGGGLRPGGLGRKLSGAPQVRVSGWTGAHLAPSVEHPAVHQAHRRHLLAALDAPGEPQHPSAADPLHHPLRALHVRVSPGRSALDGPAPAVERRRAHRLDRVITPAALSIAETQRLTRPPSSRIGECGAALA